MAGDDPYTRAVFAYLADRQPFIELKRLRLRTRVDSILPGLARFLRTNCSTFEQVSLVWVEDDPQEWRDIWRALLDCENLEDLQLKAIEDYSGKSFDFHWSTRAQITRALGHLLSGHDFDTLQAILEAEEAAARAARNSHPLLPGSIPSPLDQDENLTQQSATADLDAAIKIHIPSFLDTASTTEPTTGFAFSPFASLFLSATSAGSGFGSGKPLQNTHLEVFGALTAKATDNEGADSG